MERIEFYRVNEPYGYMSNFAAYPITLDGTLWPTSEHYFQAQKFQDKAIQDRIRACATPKEAAELGRDRQYLLRSDWERVKEDIMYRAIYAKFTQHSELREQLLATGDATLVEHSVLDSYWADGGDGSGQNRLGHLLMRLRETLRDAASR